VFGDFYSEFLKTFIKDIAKEQLKIRDLANSKTLNIFSKAFRSRPEMKPSDAN
jgi:hypothetical protein